MSVLLALISMAVLFVWLTTKRPTLRFISNILLMLLPLWLLFVGGSKVYALALCIPIYFYSLFNDHENKIAKNNYKNIILMLPTAGLIWWLVNRSSINGQVYFDPKETVNGSVLLLLVIFVAAIAALISSTRTKGNRTNE
ncbi:MAG: hypothetical protein V1647_06305 [Pseudomonadota bacterium]